MSFCNVRQKRKSSDPKFRRYTVRHQGKGIQKDAIRVSGHSKKKSASSQLIGAKKVRRT